MLIIVYSYNRILFSAVSPYNPESKFSMNALDRLEAAGVPVLTSLAEVASKQRLVDEIGITVPERSNPDTITMRSVLGYWIHAPSCPRPPNWSSLCGVLN